MACPDARVTVGTSPWPRQRGAISTSGRNRFGIGSESSERCEPERRPHATGVGEDAKEEPSHEAIAERALVLSLDGGARALDEPVVANARRARGQAGHAAEAAVEVLWRPSS